MQYVNGHVPQGTFVNEINAEVSKVKENKEMEKSYMTYEMALERHRRKAKNIGITIGREERLRRGLSQGLKQGQAAWSQLRAQKIALSMLEDKASMALISKYTGLSEQEIRSLAKEHHLL